jgi:hypothetical protein
VVGHVETFRLMLHEGGSIDGELKMLKQPAPAEADAARGGSARASRDPGPRSTASAIGGSHPVEAGADSPDGQTAVSVAAAGAEPIG